MTRWALIALLALAGCAPKAGDRCSRQPDEMCIDDGRALVCDGSKWVILPCRPVACGKSWRCLQRPAAAGDACVAGQQATSCSEDRRQALACKSGRWEVREACAEGTGCTYVADDAVACEAP